MNNSTLVKVFILQFLQELNTAALIFPPREMPEYRIGIYPQNMEHNPRLSLRTKFHLAVMPPPRKIDVDFQIAGRVKFFLKDFEAFLTLLELNKPLSKQGILEHLKQARKK